MTTHVIELAPDVIEVVEVGTLLDFSGGGSGGPSTTDALPEGLSNLYYTAARADTRIQAAIVDDGTLTSQLFSAAEIISRLATKAPLSHSHAVADLVSGGSGGYLLYDDGSTPAWSNSPTLAKLTLNAGEVSPNEILLSVTSTYGSATGYFTVTSYYATTILSLGSSTSSATFNTTAANGQPTTWDLRGTGNKGLLIRQIVTNVASAGDVKIEANSARSASGSNWVLYVAGQYTGNGTQDWLRIVPTINSASAGWQRGLYVTPAYTAGNYRNAEFVAIDGVSALVVEDDNGLYWLLKNGAGAAIGAARLEAEWSNSAAGTERGLLKIVAGNAGTLLPIMQASYDSSGAIVQSFYGLSTPVPKPTVTGSRAGNAALASLLSALAAQGLITDSSTA